MIRFWAVIGHRNAMVKLTEKKINKTMFKRNFSIRYGYH